MNGIILDGKVYEAVESKYEITCSKCDFEKTCRNYELCETCGLLFGNDTDLRFSPELTDKLNKQ